VGTNFKESRSHKSKILEEGKKFLEESADFPRRKGQTQNGVLDQEKNLPPRTRGGERGKSGEVLGLRIKSKIFWRRTSAVISWQKRVSFWGDGCENQQRKRKKFERK